MDHVAIMKKSWKLTGRILSGRKTIESRWYTTKRAPWGIIKAGDTVYFKDSGDMIKLKADVAKVLQFQDLTPSKVQEILSEYGKADGIDIDEGELLRFYELFENRKYCILVFLKNPQSVEPFDISKKGFGMMCAWLAVDDITRIKK